MITDALASDNTSGKRAREFMILLSHGGGNQNSIPTTVQQVRAIYDQLLQDQIKPEDTPDGRFFRSQVVSIFDGSNKPVHRGVTPESAIIENVTTALEHAQSPEIPPIFSALVAHIMFEYTHPFYDGNGRFGRYLLSAHLGRAMTLPAVLTLAVTLNKERARYYKAFSKVENPLNYGDATSFLLTMLGMVEAAQNDILDELNAKKKDLEQLSRTVDSLPGAYAKTQNILFVLGQMHLFKDPLGLNLKDAATITATSQKTARARLHELENAGLVLSRTAKKALHWSLTPAGVALLNLLEHAAEET